jgi:hypothetical protein
MTNDPNQPEAELESSPDPETSINIHLAQHITDFAASIKAIAKSQPLTMSVLAAMHLGLEKRHFEFLRSECEIVEETEERIRASVPPNLLHRCSLERDELEVLARARNILPPTYVVALVSQLDFFLGRLLRWMFVAKPELLNGSERVLTFAQLASFASIDDARDSIIEKEVETFLRKSHRDQFKWLEERLGISLTKELASWPTFIELTERRNLFVHANGRVSQHYLQTGRTEGFSVDGLAPGDALRVDRQYFTSEVDPDHWTIGGRV